MGGANLQVMKSGTALRCSLLIGWEVCLSSGSQLSPASRRTAGCSSSSNTCSCSDAPSRSRKSSGGQRSKAVRDSDIP